MEEKRRSVRVRSDIIVSFRVRSSGIIAGSRVKDISQLGLSFSSKHNFIQGSTIEVEIRSNDLKARIIIKAQVVRITHRADARFPFEVALLFLDFPVDKRSVLHAHIQEIIVRGAG